ncbi:MAG TPA: DUF4337 domain-containing protein [Abditibacteriaceae bacterium]
MDARDAAEQIAEAGDGEKFRARAALWIGILALLMAISGLGGGNAAEDMVAANVQANDTWAFYQAKNVRQTANKLAAEELEVQLLLHGDKISAQAHKTIEGKIAKMKTTAERYEDESDPKAPNDPLKGEGKKQLAARAKDFEDQRDRASDQDVNFDFADVFLQIAVVLGSVAILALSRPTLAASFVCGALGALLTLNGFMLWFKMPF